MTLYYLLNDWGNNWKVKLTLKKGPMIYVLGWLHSWNATSPYYFNKRHSRLEGIHEIGSKTVKVAKNIWKILLSFFCLHFLHSYPNSEALSFLLLPTLPITDQICKDTNHWTKPENKRKINLCSFWNLRKCWVSAHKQRWSN